MRNDEATMQGYGNRNSRIGRDSRGSRPEPAPNKPRVAENSGNVATNAKMRYERYMALARAAALSGDRVQMENFYQHAEHYLRQMKQQLSADDLAREVANSNRHGPQSQD